eukprot:6208226-Pleurochrysis_carterae.AAC.2
MSEAAVQTPAEAAPPDHSRHHVTTPPWLGEQLSKPVPKAFRHFPRPNSFLNNHRRLPIIFVAVVVAFRSGVRRLCGFRGIEANCLPKSRPACSRSGAFCA